MLEAVDDMVADWLPESVAVRVTVAVSEPLTARHLHALKAAAHCTQDKLNLAEGINPLPLIMEHCSIKWILPSQLQGCSIVQTHPINFPLLFHLKKGAP